MAAVLGAALMIETIRGKIRIRLKAMIALLVICVSISTAGQTRWFEGTYRNPALGYSIRVPRGLKGMTGDQAGPERGFRIYLPSGGEIVVFGEPNSLEWKNPEEGIRKVLSWHPCSSGKPEISQARVGKRTGAKGSLVCDDRVLKMLLVFRPRGGPIYWLQLETVRSHESVDDAIFGGFAASFKLIRWE